jgi:hypothetical protein
MCDKTGLSAEACGRCGCAVCSWESLGARALAHWAGGALHVAVGVCAGGRRRCCTPSEVFPGQKMNPKPDRRDARS